jgi:ADP-ribose pyrophosphatase YjhB (NUDIX family)
MPNKYFVYTIVFSRTSQDSVRFIGFQKRAKGYFFSSRSGAIIPQGQPLRGAAKFALPGGSFEGRDWDDNDDVLAQCQKEFTEECGRQISFVTNDEVVSGGVEDDDAVIHAVAYLQRWGVIIQGAPNIKGYAAMYIKVPDKELELVADYIGECFAQRDEAVKKIVSGQWKAGDYAKIARTFPMAPKDDEIDLIEPPIREIRQGEFEVDPLIRGLEGDQDTDWFAQILKGLETIDS